MIRIASYNVENLFVRPKALRGSDWPIGEPILEAYREANKQMQITHYSAADRTRIRDLLVTLDIYSINNQGAISRKRSLNPRWGWLIMLHRNSQILAKSNPKDINFSLIVTNLLYWNATLHVSNGFRSLLFCQA
ncbi:MAG: hypothetical protein AB2689_25355 [Candidatus Thiodiazotropha taylori]